MSSSFVTVTELHDQAFKVSLGYVSGFIPRHGSRATSGGKLGESLGMRLGPYPWSQ